MQRIDEVSFADLTPLGECLKRHLGKNRFIHFTKTPNKLGVNVGKHHLDPPGVYFYPVDWLWEHEDFHDGQQFATNWPYFYIVEIDFSRPGIDLSNISERDIEELGRKNGWLDEYDDFQPNYQLRNGPAQKMWDVLKSMNGNAHQVNQGWIEKRNANAMTWLQAFKGMAWIRDRNGIILSHEPEQVCVMDPRCMRLVESGSQNTVHQHDWEKWSYWSHAVPKMLNQLQQKHGGQVTWKYKRPKWSVSGEDWSFSIEWSDSFSMSGLLMQWRTGRAVDGSRISTRVMKDTSYEGVLEIVEDRLSICHNFDGNDLTFDAVMDPHEATATLGNLVVDPLSLEYEYEIDNNYKSIRVFARRVRGKPPVSTSMRIHVREEVTLTLDVEVNGNRVVNVSGTPENFEEHFWKALEMYGKSISHFHPDSDHYKHFSKEEWPQFLGWLFRQTGLKVLEKYDEAFSNTRNLRHLYGQIDWIFSRVGW